MAESQQSWDYLERLQGVELHRLYRSPPSALAVFRKVLSGLAKHFVMLMLYSPRPTPLAEFEMMVKSSSSKERHEAIEQLHRYHIVKNVNIKAGKAIGLVPDFARSLRQVLTGSSTKGCFGEIAIPPASEIQSIDDLDEYARMQWEGILGYMVGSSTLRGLQAAEDRLPDPSQSVIELLKAGSLIKVQGTQSRPGEGLVTQDGFSFVLKDVNTQVWELLFLYVENAEAFDLNKVEVLSFIFFLASLELGSAYSVSSLPQPQKDMLRDLLSLGIVYQPNDEAEYFYPTRLATTLTSSSSTAVTTTSKTLGSSLQANSASSAAHSTSQTPGSGFIIIETNFRLYAYTSSPLQIALLSIFITLRSRHPNMVTGKLTKRSVQRAVQRGITAEQLCSYLTAHAHPVMRRTAVADWVVKQNQKALISDDPTAVATDEKFTVIPRTILDQIKLWQMERDRVVSTSGYLLKDFASASEYLAPCRYADETGVLVWKDDRKRMFFVSRIEGVQTFMQDRKNKANSFDG